MPVFKTFPARILSVALLCAGTTAFAAPPAGGDIAGAIRGPHFVSLKSDKVNVRGGPTKDHDVVWVYTQAGLPVEIVAEFENWRRIRDWEGAEGWVYHSLLSGKRTARVLPLTKGNDEPIPIRNSADAGSAVVAMLQPGVLGTVKRCSGTWCRIAGGGFDGWIEQDRLWGVYPNEKVE